ncbi:unnamed protein product, partial [Nesidiocoris tenuis]
MEPVLQLCQTFTFTTKNILVLRKNQYGNVNSLWSEDRRSYTPTYRKGWEPEPDVLQNRTVRRRPSCLQW